MIEEVYADYINNMKRLGEQARADSRHTGAVRVNPEAKKVYRDQVKSIDDKYALAKLNAPRERQANRIANKNVEIYKKANPALNNKEDKDAQDKLKKIKHREIDAARKITGAQRNPIHLTPLEWEAIDAGALTDNKISDVLRYVDKNEAKDLALGKSKTGLSDAKLSAARQMLDREDLTWSDVASRLGVSVSTLQAAIKADNEGRR
jgi:DNA-binding transcriptional regulator GbsR (MarR family)